MSLSENLKRLRKKNGYTQLEIAEYLGIDTTNYGRMERGIRVVSAERLELLAKFYNISVDEMLGKSIQPSTQTSLEKNNYDFLEYLKKENEFLRNSIISKDRQLDFLIEITKEFNGIKTHQK